MSDSGQPVTKPTCYCRKCWYVLDGLTENRCPECGRKFDPDNKRTYSTRPRLRWWLVMCLRTAAVVLLIVGIPGGWLYRIHHVNQQAMVWVEAQSGRYETQPLGPQWLTDWLGEQYLPVIDTVVSLDVQKVRGTRITDAELAHLQGLSNLQRLHLRGTQITDAGLAHLQGLSNLQMLCLDSTQVTDAGLAHLQGLSNLEQLYLSDTQITDAGLAHLQGLSNLQRLHLNNTQVTDAGLAHLRGLSNLQRLRLHKTQITDAGLAHLQGLSNLQRLHLRDTQVTDAGVAELKKAFPNTQIYH